jgi:hypothetical protein
MKEIIVTTQKEMDLVGKEQGVEIVIKNTKEVIFIYGNSTVRAYGNSTVRAYDNSTVRAYDNSTVRACGNSTVRAYGNSTVRAYGNSTVTAYDNSTVTAYDNYVTFDAILMFAVVIMIGCICKVKRKSKTAHIIKTKIKNQYTKKDFIDLYGNGGKEITLYKSVNPNNSCDFYSGKIQYTGTVECPDWDNDQNKQCGNGLHLSPLPEMALKYNEGKLLVCKANIKDFVVYPYDITKVRCKKVTVIGEYKK